MEIKTTDIFEKSFEKLFKKDRFLLNELDSLVDKLKLNHQLGINLGGGKYKIRIKNKTNNKGKSGGYRVITYVKIENIVLLVYIYSKNEIENISDEKIDSFIKSYNIDTKKSI